MNESRPLRKPINTRTEINYNNSLYDFEYAKRIFYQNTDPFMIHVYFEIKKIKNAIRINNNYE